MEPGGGGSGGGGGGGGSGGSGGNIGGYMRVGPGAAAAPPLHAPMELMHAAPPPPVKTRSRPRQPKAEDTPCDPHVVFEVKEAKTEDDAGESESDQDEDHGDPDEKQSGEHKDTGAVQGELMERLAAAGVCPQNYTWNRGYFMNACGKCKGVVGNGFKCGGGTHFVCAACVDG